MFAINHAATALIFKRRHCRHREEESDERHVLDTQVVQRDLAPLAFLVELVYGLVCWWIFRSGKALLAVILGFNLANISEFFRSIPGPEDALAGHPLTLVTVILVQVVITVWAVWWSAGAVPTATGIWKESCQ